MSIDGIQEQREPPPNNHSFFGKNGEVLQNPRILATNGVTSLIFSANYPSGEQAVVKQLRPERPEDENTFRGEVAVLQRLRERNVTIAPELHNTVFNGPENTYLVMDMANGLNGFDLDLKYFPELRTKNLREAQAKSLDFTLTLVKGIMAAREAGVVYKDTKSASQGNIFVDPETGQVTLVDWGLSTLDSPNEPIADLIWAVRHVNAFNFVDRLYPSAQAYEVKGVEGIDMNKFFKRLSPAIRRIIARTSDSTKLPRYRSGNEIITDLTEARLHVDDDFQPATNEEIDALFGINTQSSILTTRNVQSDDTPIIINEPGKELPIIRKTELDSKQPDTEQISQPPLNEQEVRPATLAAIQELRDTTALIRNRTSIPFFNIAERIYNTVSQPSGPNQIEGLPINEFVDFNMLTEYLSQWPKELQSTVTTMRFLAHLFDRIKPVRFGDMFTENRAILLNGIRAATETTFLGERTPTSVREQAKDFYRYLQNPPFSLHHFLQFNPLPQVSS